jgi:hypothetical protein
MKIWDGTEIASVNASNQLETAEANSAAIKTAVEIIDNPVSGSEMLIAGGATQTNDVKVTLDGEVPAVDATGQGDVPVTLDGEVPQIQGDAAEDAAVSGNPVLVGGRYDTTARTLDNGDVGAVALYDDGSLIIKDFGVEVSLGNVPGYTKINKFGLALDADSGIATDVWDGADGTTSTDVWVAPTQARVHAIVSTDIDDSDSGGVNPQSTGMRTVRVYGLQTWSSAESSEDVTLDGTTAVNTSNSYVIIHRMKGLTFGSTGSNEGIIKATAAVDGTITAIIQAGQGQTQMAIYGIPDTQTMHIKGITADVPKAGGVSGVLIDAKLLVKENADQSDAGFINKEQFFFSDTLLLRRTYEIPKSVTGPAIVKIQVNTNKDNTDVSAAFDAYVVNN